jgi:hypothetical protein
LKVSSPSGDFEVLIKDAVVEGDFVALKGKVGVWESVIYLGSGDLWRLTKIFLRPAVLFLLLRLSLKFLTPSKNSNRV